MSGRAPGLVTCAVVLRCLVLTSGVCRCLPGGCQSRMCGSRQPSWSAPPSACACACLPKKHKRSERRSGAFAVCRLQLRALICETRSDVVRRGRSFAVCFADFAYGGPRGDRWLSQRGRNRTCEGRCGRIRGIWPAIAWKWRGI
eukprot:3728952-Rhodomonas_salina.2